MLALNYPWEDEKLMVEVFDLAIAQGHFGVHSVFGHKPPTLPEAEWHRLREITGVAEFQAKK
jgi:hypothetical protein